MSHRVIEIFKEISKIPRCSKNCERIASWICSWARNNNFKYEKDDFNNVIITVPPTNGFENRNPIALQGHMDMVCVKENHINHDFSKDPIKVIEEKGWLRANGTTLGADDGVALAIGMALAEDETAEHPKLELVFTADEEIGLVGAKHLKENFIESKKLINIDTVKEDVFIIGCAGGEDIDLSLNIERKPRKLAKPYKIVVSGLKGGHSGIEINSSRANAIKLLNEILDRAFESIELVSFKGGKARNAIPAYSEATIYTDTHDEVLKIAESVKNYAKALFTDEDGINITVEELKTDKNYVVKKDDFKRIVDLVNKLPHGVHEMFDEDTPKISNNLAIVELKESSIKVCSNQRSLTEEGLSKIAKNIEEIANEFSCEIKRHSKYPPWTPNEESQLVNQAKYLFKKMFNREAKTKVIHAGLECGIFASKLKDVDMVSIAPNMKYIHTPKEMVEIESFIRIYKFIKELVKQ